MAEFEIPRELLFVFSKVVAVADLVDALSLLGLGAVARVEGKLAASP